MNENWTTENIPDLTGKVIIITGANIGLGFETALEVARKGAQTIMACRNMDKAQAALADIHSEIPNAHVEIMQLDLASQESIRQFVEAFHQKYDRLDILVNNAGIMMVPYGTTVDGFERQFGTNHLGHFALTGRLLDLIKKTPGARVVTVSSLAHHRGDMDFDNLMYEGGNGYDRQDAYGRSKLANLLFTYELQRQFEKHDVEATAVAAHPGISTTNLADHLLRRWYFRILVPIFKLMAQSAAQGALTNLRAAVDPTIKGGQYVGPDKPNERTGYPVVVQSNAASHNEADAQKLWQVSEELTGVHFNWNN
ncbi:oxidoreductase [Candidatus Leptofilum sp.]|uniref:oxidoreductase n=1 Tax=Candidatus Leptofilum sp. TaxID=3241576 RepID=UPI003B59B05A